MPRLSRRETEVAHLVGAGLTNRQIADRLFVSERTAEYHVEQIRNKLGYHTRAEIARWVAQSPDESAPSRLPVQLTSFIGRTRDLAAVSSLLGQTRLVTITGAGGTGKTRLALEVALRVGRDFGDGAWFVDLQSLEDEKLLVPEVAAALEVADLDRELASSRRL
ncbi:MAG: ATPase, partial [Deltaproteobacteria bacterium]